MRTKASVKNVTYNLILQVLIMASGFIVRTALVKSLGKEYMGLGGLFTNIISMLSLAELGIGLAITFSLYKPLAESDERQVSALMNFYKLAYRVIGCVIGVAGIIAIPFLRFFMAKNESPADFPGFYYIYFLFLFNSVFSYLAFAYKRSILSADQKSWAIAQTNIVTVIISTVLQLYVLKLFSRPDYRYIAVLIVQIFFVFVVNFITAYISDRMYPYLRKYKKTKIHPDERRAIYKNVFALSINKISVTIVNTSDVLLVSIFCGVGAVGLYNNYALLLTSINALVTMIFNPLVASLGNLSVTENENSKYNVFRRVYFANMWIIGFCSICFTVMFQMFIQYWLGADFLMAVFIMLTTVFSFYLRGTEIAVNLYRHAEGLYWQGRYRPVAMAVLNIISSVIFYYICGMGGIFIGTIISNLLTVFWFDPWLVYKNVFKRPVAGYFIEYAVHFIITIISGSLIWWLCSVFFPVNNFWSVMGRLGTVVVISNLIYFLLFFRREEFKYFKALASDTLKDMFKRFIRKKN